MNEDRHKFKSLGYQNNINATYIKQFYIFWIWRAKYFDVVHCPA